MELKDKKLFLLDMDGTIYLDDSLFDGTIEFLQHINDIGGRYLFLTNNSSKGVDAYVEKLNKLGIKAEARDFLTSVDATAAFLKERYGADYGSRKIYILGTESFRKQMIDEGFKVTTDADEDVETLLIGFDRELTFKKLEDASILLTRDIEYFATNPDWVCPTEFGSVPDCGSMCQMLEHATGRLPHFIGKPQPEMALMAMVKTGYKAEETILVGDRLYTDIACGVNAGIDTCFVLSGEGTLEDIEKFNINPTYILKDINELLRRTKNEA